MDPQTSLLSPRVLARARPAEHLRSRGSRWILAAAAAWCRLEAFAANLAETHSHPLVMRVVDSAQRVSGAIWTTALDVNEKTWLTVRIYDDCSAFRASGNELFEIETNLFANRLPRPPARILVGACGTGREAIALAARGYDVEAFDPADDCVTDSDSRLAGRGRVRQLSYEQLSAIVLDGATVDPLGDTRFDAVVLGCGSLSHVLDPCEQQRLMRALQTLCPLGPIIGSFLWVTEPTERPIGMAARLGTRIGRAIARMRGLPPGDLGCLSYRARRGFAYTFTQREFEELALNVQRRVAWEQYAARPSLYATLLPIDASSRVAIGDG
jgi:SAM-dependent methyltransferase